jgi:hypothetical protein
VRYEGGGGDIEDKDINEKHFYIREKSKENS